MWCRGDTYVSPIRSSNRSCVACLLACVRRDQMLSLEELVVRVRAEHREMPGLRPAFARRFRVRSDHVHSRHHAVILVLEVVTMQEVTAAVPVPADNHVDLLPVLDGNGIFPAVLLSQRRAAVAPQ